MSENIDLEIEGLSDLQLEELKAALAECGQNCILEKPVPSLEGESHGEPILAAVLIKITPIVISAFAAWLAKQKPKRRTGFRYAKIDEKGRTEVFEVVITDYDSTSSIEALLRRIFNVDSE